MANVHSQNQVSEYFRYLDELRDSGLTNMFGAAPHLMNAFPFSDIREARQILSAWMDTFDPEKSIEVRASAAIAKATAPNNEKASAE